MTGSICNVDRYIYRLQCGVMLLLSSSFFFFFFLLRTHGYG